MAREVGDGGEGVAWVDVLHGGVGECHVDFLCVFDAKKEVVDENATRVFLCLVWMSFGAKVKVEVGWPDDCNVQWKWCCKSKAGKETKMAV